jgi:hypothetical protein
MTETVEPPDLWAVHVVGPDDMRPTASRHHAQLLSMWINIGLLPHIVDPGTSYIWAIPVRWTGEPATHAVDLARENRDPRWSTINDSILAGAALNVFGNPTPRIYPDLPPYGFTQYADDEGDYLTVGAYPPDEQAETGSCVAIATNGHDGCRLTPDQARDLATRLLAASGTEDAEDHGKAVTR